MIPLLLIITSFLLAARVKDSKTLFFLMCILAYINTSVAILDGFLGGELFRDYQLALRMSKYNAEYMKSILLNITIISMFITPKMLEKASNINLSRESIERKSNIVITIGGLLVITLFIVFGYEKGNYATFRASARTIYEYAILLFVFIWYYSKNFKLANILLSLLAILYILQGLYYGDRSSALVMIVLLFMFVLEKINIKKMLVFLIGGISFANMVAVYRNLSEFDIATIFNKSINNGLMTIFSDTASSSYYTGVVILASRELVPENIGYYLFKFIFALFVGSSSSLSEGSNITTVASNYYHVGGGGLYPSYFYFFGGYLGVIIGATILSLIIRTVYTNDKPMIILLQYYLTVMTFRWYLYTPFTLFRTSLLMFLIMIILTKIIDSITSRS